ncbi:unnamed protein product [Mycena citricolor]|uniref:P-loop containing nucleoside triphosphate hydrolase protein n=1 Tax=Mycena citricolor TaxID=2018698 RepID=A0AAD2H3L2_9AGAR|nr:unnamed protein product [Mycena citricolor]
MGKFTEPINGNATAGQSDDALQDQTIVQTRGYQQEMLEESLRRNVIIALGTGAGKTHIAVLRIKIAIEREPKKVAWFMAPTVALCEQQYRVIRECIPAPVAYVTGSNEPEQWKDAQLWESIISTHRVVVTTPQILLDALYHAFIILGRDISLLVFDEAHHAVSQHPYNQIMGTFYANCLEATKPTVMGLTASPIYGGNVAQSLRLIEHNLRSTVCAPRENKEELARHVYRPVFKHVLYHYVPDNFSTNLAAFDTVYDAMDIENDPYVISLRGKLGRMTRGTPDYQRTDQQLSKAKSKKKTFAHDNMKDISTIGAALCQDIGPWAADWYVFQAVDQALGTVATPFGGGYNKDKQYLLDLLNQVVLSPVSYGDIDILEESSDKVRALVDCLLAEKAEAESHNQVFSGLIFVERREAVLALAELLSHHPATRDLFQVGCLVGGSDTTYHNLVVDITKPLSKAQSAILSHFRAGTKNLIISTSVAEEGIDIQACGCVIRWDPPRNMASWAQSRGRARRERSTFTLMFAEDGTDRASVREWEILEQEMIAQYDDPSRQAGRVAAVSNDDDDDDDEMLEFRIESTGAVLDLNSAIPHLNYFCAVIPNASHADFKPIYDLDPPEFPEGWHSFAKHSTSTAIESYPGPFGAHLTLPRLLPAHLREFDTPRIHSSKLSAYRHVAFQAYRTLYENGLLNDSLLPLTSVVEPELEDEVKEILKEVERRAGFAKVSVQMNPWTGDDPQVWHAAALTIEGLNPILLLTHTKAVEIAADEAIQLHRSGRTDYVTIEPLEFQVTPAIIARARDYTRRLFWSFSASRMDWNDLDFCYLFLPDEYDEDEFIWNDRRWWQAQQLASGAVTADPGPFLANALSFGQFYSYPSDLALVRDGPRLAKMFQFVRWRFADDPLSAEEELEMRASLEKRFGIEDVPQITYPLLEVQALLPRTNFLTPSQGSGTPRQTMHLLPRLSYVMLCSRTETEYSLLLPCILRSLDLTLTVESIKETLFSGTRIAGVPRNLLTEALCAPTAQEQVNYQRMETLGDTVLKFMASIQLLAEYPLWHEGYLTQKMGHSVSNVRLAKANLQHELFKWIIRDRLLGRKWKPRYFSTDVAQMDVQDTPVMKNGPLARKKKEKKNSGELSTKGKWPSLIGAVYLHGGFDYALECASFFDLNIKWEPLPQRIETLLSRVETATELPKQVDYVEQMLGYTFERKLLVVEALTHASYQQDLRTVSYERLEFCGDAVLDMIVGEYLFRAEGKNYSPGHMFLRKSAMVNAHILAFICLGTHLEVTSAMPHLSGSRSDRRTDRTLTMQQHSRSIYLYQCLLHTNPKIMDDQQAAFVRFQQHRAEIEEALASNDVGAPFPWTALFRMQAPKFLSDMIESLVGAVFLDSQGDLDVVRGVLRKLGHLQILEHVVARDMDVQHPVSRLAMWASKKAKNVAYEFLTEKGRISCAVSIDGAVIEETRATDNYKGRSTKDEVRLVAADRAVKLFRLRLANDSAKADSKKRKHTDSMF